MSRPVGKIIGKKLVVVNLPKGITLEKGDKR